MILSHYITGVQISTQTPETDADVIKFTANSVLTLTMRSRVHPPPRLLTVRTVDSLRPWGAMPRS